MSRISLFIEIVGYFFEIGSPTNPAKINMKSNFDKKPSCKLLKF
jgi:hypothetical protein